MEEKQSKTKQQNESQDLTKLLINQQRDLIGNRVSVLESAGLKGMSNLQELFLDTNPLETIEPGAFDELESVKSMLVVEKIK